MFSHFWVTHPISKSACVSPPQQPGKFVPLSSPVSRWRQKLSPNRVAVSLCFGYLESTTMSSSAFLLLAAARAANMTALINNRQREPRVRKHTGACWVEHKQHSMRRLLCQFPLVHETPILLHLPPLLLPALHFPLPHTQTAPRLSREELTGYTFMESSCNFVVALWAWVGFFFFYVLLFKEKHTKRKLQRKLQK